MGSENNMVAVPGQPGFINVPRGAFERVRDGGRDPRDLFALFEASVKRVEELEATLAHLAQPDAQQGEGLTMTYPDSTPGDPSYEPARFVPATPPSPALDAATIERCAQAIQAQIDRYHRDAFEQRAGCRAALAAIRALPNAEKKA